ncbi:unnamed protein product [Adineta steineri]|uniref:Arrestin C-terminal-like domain-containing protein n=1 Tax=Adineta steineri TaxID=433720 RepID=A0A814NGJ2_9BILA|nr:unnamed protein product [Adineta steineri]CAF1093312.1 unnamed protein product [Adineta steineri]CAF3782118.1 unnamed protein product [Adineta steineri]
MAQQQTNGNGAADLSLDDSKKQGTRVFKKSSPNSKITCYLGKRDFIDYSDHIDPIVDHCCIDGVVLVDPEYVKDRKVYASVLAAFRYGREDLDVLGLTFRKDLFCSTQQIYPPIDDQKKSLTHLQQRLLRKLGPNAYPFYFEIPHNAPASVTLQPAAGDTGKPCGVDYELKTYVAETSEDKSHKRSSVRLAIRKLTYAPETPAPQPVIEAHKDFMMSPAPLHLECTLDKEMYYHGESINVNVVVTNNSNKTLRKIRISVKYKDFFFIFIFSEGFPITPCSNLTKVYSLTPLLANNKDKRGLALDGKLKHEDTNLASSTIIRTTTQKENLGIIVQYKVKVKLIVAMGGDLAVELPFTLTHPKPPPTPSPSRQLEFVPNQQNPDDQQAVDVPVDHNLIQLDTNFDNVGHDDDFIFEEFARIRLKGHESGHEDTEA